MIKDLEETLHEHDVIFHISIIVKKKICVTVTLSGSINISTCLM